MLSERAACDGAPFGWSEISTSSQVVALLRGLRDFGWHTTRRTPGRLEAARAHRAGRVVDVLGEGLAPEDMTPGRASVPQPEGAAGSGFSLGKWPSLRPPWAQDGYDVRFDWGPGGAAWVGAPPGAVVVVDVLSFTTAVTVAVERGAVVHPAPWRDARAAEIAQRERAVLAVGRREVTADHPWSLSPAALRAAPSFARLVLPSPNGATIAAAAAAAADRPVVAASLRNARAVARWLSAWRGGRDATVTVIAAGERWPDGSLRPALEDLLGAGAVLAALAAAGRRTESPEAAAARAAYEATPAVADAVRRCASGVELRTAGFGEDVEIALELDASEVVPVLADGAFAHVPAHL